MTILNSFKQRFNGGDAQAVGGETTQANGGSMPIPGYDRLSEKDLIADLSKHSQVELTAVDTYERSHKERQAVFNKLRYLRGKEPLDGYDSLDVKAIASGLEGANVETLHRTREYERKFRRRPDVLDEITAGLHKHTASFAPSWLRAGAARAPTMDLRQLRCRGALRRQRRAARPSRQLGRRPPGGTGLPALPA